MKDSYWHTRISSLAKPGKLFCRERTYQLLLHNSWTNDSTVQGSEEVIAVFQMIGAQIKLHDMQETLLGYN